MGYVLQWLIEGHQIWMDAGKRLPSCAVVEAETTEYFEAQSTPQLWLKERCEIVDGLPDLHLHTVTELYRDYKNFKGERGEPPVSQSRWEQALKIAKEDKVKTRKGICVRRIRLLPPMNFAPPPIPAAAMSWDEALMMAETLSSVN